MDEQPEPGVVASPPVDDVEPSPSEGKDELHEGQVEPEAPLSGDNDPIGTSSAAGRRRARTHGRPKTWVIVAGTLLLLVMLAYSTTYTRLFAAETVRVEGVSHLTEEQVLRIARIGVGVNVFRLDTAKAERRLERNAWIADAVVTRSLPSTVTIQLRERSAAAIVTTDASGARSFVASDGTILDPAQGPSGLPEVLSDDGAVPPATDQRALGATVAASLPPSLVADVDTVMVGTDGSVALQLAGGVVVSYGDARHLASKGQAARAVLLWADREGVRLGSIDVGTPGAPTAQRAGGLSVTPRV